MAAGVSCWPLRQCRVTRLSCRVRQGEDAHSWILYLIFVPEAGQGTLWGPEICCVVFWDDHRSIQIPYFFSLSWYIIEVETDMKLLQKKINPFSVISIFGVALARPAFCVLTVHDNCTIIYINFFSLSLLQNFLESSLPKPVFLTPTFIPPSVFLVQRRA